MKNALALAALLISSSSFATTFDYSCFSYAFNGDKDTSYQMDLSVSSTKATADIISESWDDLDGARNTKYKPKGYAKFGHLLIVEEALIAGGKLLKDGTLGGFARVEGEAEGGFFQYKFICKRN